RGRRRARPGASHEQVSEVGVQRVAPPDPVVRVAVLDEAGVPAAAGQGGRDLAVVVEVLLAGAARERERDRVGLVAAGDDGRGEAGDAREPTETRLVCVEAPAEEAARLEQERAE